MTVEKVIELLKAEAKALFEKHEEYNRKANKAKCETFVNFLWGKGTAFLVSADRLEKLSKKIEEQEKRDQTFKKGCDPEPPFYVDDNDWLGK